MNVLVLGATGFIGAAIVDAALHAGHGVAAAGRDGAAVRRRWPQLRIVECDFRHEREPQAWARRLAGVDVVVNAVGVFRAPPEAMQAIHADGPIALFEACAAAGIRVLQLSALGAAPDACTAFLRSKSLADERLLALGNGVVLRPSLVFGLGGRSARALLDLALAPVWPLPAGGIQPVQPLHVDDLASAAVALLPAHAGRGVVDAVGPASLPLGEYLQCLRLALGRPRGRVLPVPMRVARPLARLAERWSSLVGEETLAMLEHAQPADPAPFARLLGRPARACHEFLEPGLGACLGRHWPARIDLALLRLALALVWLGSGLLSLFVFPIESSLALLQRSGVPDAIATTVLLGSAGLDLVFGVLTLFAPRGRRAYRVQLALVAFYTVVIGVMLPEFLWHPFAPILKNLPLMAALWLLYRDEHVPGVA